MSGIAATLFWAEHRSPEGKVLRVDLFQERGDLSHEQAFSIVARAPYPDGTHITTMRPTLAGVRA